MSSKISVGKNGDKTKDILLLETGKRGAIRILFGRTGIIILLLALQVLLLFYAFRFLKVLTPYVVVTLLVFTVIMVIYIINSEHNSTVKMTWIVLFMLLPGFGEFLYIFIQ